MKRGMKIIVIISMLLFFVMYADKMVLAQEKTESVFPTAEELISHDHLIYLVNCGTKLPYHIPAGYRKMGLYQSVVEQEYGPDEQTGKWWGYYENRPAIAYPNQTFDGENLTDSKRYNYGAEAADYTYVKDVSGIYYHFELPDGTYDVKLGFYNDWSGRSVDIVLEDQTVGRGVYLTQNSKVEKRYAIEVVDGELNVKIHNPNRTNQYEDALLSYIIVEVPIRYDAALLKALVKEYSLTDEERAIYSASTLEKYDEAWYYADKVANNPQADSFSTTKIKSYYDKLQLKYRCLREKGEVKTYTSITGTGGGIWCDTNGTEIQAHGGQIQQFTHNGETKYYWYGEDKTDGYRSVDGGVRVYSSADLYNWTEEGVAMRNLTDIYDFEEDYFASLYGDKTLEEKQYILDAINDSYSVIERPKVIYNKKTGKYVMWFHADGPLSEGGSNYEVASAGVAVSDTPTGPFTFIGRYRLNYVEGAYHEKGMARDMNLFVDDDETAYIIYSSEENATLFISKLNEDYTYLSSNPEDAKEGVDFVRSSCFVRKHREAPALFKYNGKYYMLTSGTEGWAATQSRYAVADSIFGEWKDMGDPCVADSNITKYPADRTFGSQSSNVFPVDAANGKFIYMGDRWNRDNPLINALNNPKYVWLPVEFGENGELILRPYEDWTLESLENKGTITSLTPLPDMVYLDQTLELPDRIDILIGTEEKSTDVIWDTGKLNKSVPGMYSITGTLTDIISAGSPRKIKTDILVAVKGAAYIVNAGARDGITYTDYDALVAHNQIDLKNRNQADQPLTDGAKWGYRSTDEVFVHKYGTNLYESLLYTKGNLSYYFSDLEQGQYHVYVGYYDPWSEYAENRAVEVRLNGQTVDNRNITGDKQGVKYTVTVTERGEINLDFIKRGEHDVLVSWILIAKDRKEERDIVKADSEDLRKLVESWKINDTDPVQEFMIPLHTKNGTSVVWISNHDAVKIVQGKAVIALQETKTPVELSVILNNGMETDTFLMTVVVPAKKKKPIEPSRPIEPIKPIKPTEPADGSGKDVIVVNVRPGKVSLKSVSSKKRGKATVTWKEVKGVSGYKLEISSKKFNWKKAKKYSVKSTKRKYTFSKLKAGKKFYVRIRAYKKAGKLKIYSKYSKIKSVKIKK